MKALGIEKQILLVVLFPILTMAVLLGYYLVYSRFSDLEQALLDRSQLLARQLASSSEYAVFSGNTTLLQQNVDAALAHQDIARVVMLDASSKPLMDKARGAWGQYENLLARVDGSSPLYQDSKVMILYQPITATQVKLDELDAENGLIPAPAAAKQLGAVIIEVSKRHTMEKKHDILLFSLTVTLLIFLAALRLALWAARSITSPIKGMSEAIHDFGLGKLDTRILARSHVHELNELTLGFNQMAEQIQHNQELLETTVAERTSDLAASEHDLRTLLENSPNIIVRYDRQLRRTYVNPAFVAISSSTREAMLGTTPSEFPGGPNSKIMETRIREVLLTGESTHFELKWPGQDGSESCSDIHLTAERDSAGNIISVLGVGHDITELNASKDELTRKELAKSRFLAAAGHDLRQPLSAANLFIDALKLTDLSPNQNKVVQRLDQAMSTFNELLEALLNISKLDAGVIKPEFAAINVARIFEWLEQSFAPMAKDKQLDFRLHFPERDALIIHSDIDLIKSVLMNLVSNAIKYTGSGAVLVSARQRGKDVLFQVWDTGIGIDAEHIGHIYDEFFQVNNPHRDRSKGLGLGLAIARRAIMLLGSNITCRSRTNHGSVFGFRLPLDTSLNSLARKSSDAVPGTGRQLSNNVRGRHFVVLEDDALVAEAICGTLEMMGARVSYFHNGDEALLNQDIDRADYYIVDYMIEGTLNGIQFLNRLRQISDRQFRAVLVTGDTSPTFIRDSANCPWPVLHKPVSISELITSLDGQEQQTG